VPKQLASDVLQTQLGIHTALNRVQLLPSRAEMETLSDCQHKLYALRRSKMTQHALYTRTHLGIDGKCRIPGVWGDDLYDSVFLPFFSNALNVLKRVLELLSSWPICLGFLQAEHAVWLGGQIVGCSVASALNCGKIERLGLAGAQRYCAHAVRLCATCRWRRSNAHSRFRCCRGSVGRGSVGSDPEGGNGRACGGAARGQKVDHIQATARADGAANSGQFGGE
jgi:hypothetical protein